MRSITVRTASLALAVACIGIGCVTTGGAVAAPKHRRPPLTLNLAPSTAAWAPASRPSGPIGRSPIANFGEVVAGCVYRSGQPTEKDYQWMKEQGFRAIVCLRREHDDGAAEMEHYGFKYLYLPIIDQTPPTMEQGEQFVRFAQDPSHWPLLVHCHGGMGRAGCMSALIRYSFDGWPMTTALREATRYRPLSWPIYGKQRRFLERWAKTHPRGALRPTAATGSGPAGSTQPAAAGQ